MGVNPTGTVECKKRVKRLFEEEKKMSLILDVSFSG